jgi:leucyl aminopeptidase (aminopeptidase T)
MDKVSDIIEGEKIHVSSASGTDLWASIKGRKAIRQYGRSLKPGASSSPPDIETALGPVEWTANGTAVIDGCIPHPALGIIHSPISLTLKDGNIISFKGGDEAEILETVMRNMNDKFVYHIAEIGIGFNNKSRLCNSMLEDEGVMGTCHFGFGSNISFGGTIESNSHLDMIFCAPTITVDDRIIIKDGQPCI